MRKLLSFVFIPALFAVGLANNVDPKEVIQQFAQKESEFRDIWQHYTYNQRIEFQVLDDFGSVRERQVMQIEVYFTTDGKRETRVVSDQGRLRSVGVTKEDVQDAIGLQPFVLTTEDLPQYEVKYEGDERVDELDTHVFSVKPRRMEKGKRYFKGKIWVDSVDRQIVMTKGRAVPDYSNNKFPEFETRREQIDGKYWFPTWTKAEDILSFGGFNYRNDVHVRQYITYDNFQKFQVGATIKYGKVEPDSSKPAETTKPVQPDTPAEAPKPTQ